MTENDLRHQLYLIIHSAETLEAAIAAARVAPSTISEHWDTLVRYASQVDEVLELGCGFSTLAWLSTGARVTSVDIEPMPWTARLLELAGPRLAAVVMDDLQLPPRRVPFLYIDTLHTYAHLAAELARHGPLADMIVLHDTHSFRDADAPLTRQCHPGDKGLWPAVEEFCEAHRYAIVDVYHHQHGLTVLRKAA
jgi:hypothetical protein